MRLVSGRLRARVVARRWPRPVGGPLAGGHGPRALSRDTRWLAVRAADAWTQRPRGSTRDRDHSPRAVAAGRLRSGAAAAEPATEPVSPGAPELAGKVTALMPATEPV